jgi:LPS-assembly lipoprotein
MSWFSQFHKSIWVLTISVIAAMVLSSCAVQPLNSAKPGAALAPTTFSNIEIFDVSNRVGQQVRNRLIFALNGGKEPVGAAHSLKLIVVTRTVDISIVTSTKAPTAAQVTVSAIYTLRQKSNGEIIATGTRNAIASFDRTNQSFANQRAERDAEDRAANEVAEQLRLLIAATLAN